MYSFYVANGASVHGWHLAHAALMLPVSKRRLP